MAFFNDLFKSATQPAQEALGGRPIAPPPDREISDIGTPTKNIMSDEAARAGMSEADIAKESMRGVSKDSQPTFNDMGMLQAGMGGGNPMLQAIQNKQAKKYSQDVNALQRKAEYNAPLEKSKRMNTVMENKLSQARALAGAADIDRQNRLAQWQYGQQQTQARNQVIFSLMGAGGSAGGAYMGSQSANKQPSPQQGQQQSESTTKWDNYTHGRQQ